MIRFTKATAPKFSPLDSQERAIRVALLEAVSRVQDATRTRDIVAALDVGNVEGAIALIRFELGEEFLLSSLPAHLRRIYESIGTAAAVEASRSLSVEYSFNLITPRAVDWVRQNAGSLIRQWGDSSRDAVRRLIAQAFRDGTTNSVLARQIKNTGIGLTWRQSRAVLNMRHRLEAEGVAAAKIDKRAERYFKQLLKSRAEMIARTERARASEHARIEAWRQAVERGLLDPTRMEREWLATQDARVCPECADLDGTRARAPAGHFLSDSGTDGGIGPPQHPRCRCVSILVRIGSRSVPRARPNIQGDPGRRPRARKS